MMRIWISILILSSGFLASSQEKVLEGTVVSGNTLEPLIGVHIKNYSSRKLAVTHVDGTFEMPVAIGDSVVVSHVGFQEISILVDSTMMENELELILAPEAVQLAEVEVNVFPEYQRFKEMILETEPVDSSISFDHLPRVVVYDPRTAPIIDPRMPPPVIGIGFNLDGLTKKGKEKKKLKKILERQQVIYQASEKFNRDWVAAATKLEGDQLTSFIEYCDFSPEYIVETPLFEINREMMALLEKFRSFQSSERKEERFTPGA